MNLEDKHRWSKEVKTNSMGNKYVTCLDCGCNKTFYSTKRTGLIICYERDGIGYGTDRPDCIK